MPYALEGLLRREIIAAENALLDVRHGGSVELSLSLPDTQVAAFLRRIDDAAQGQVQWLSTQD